MLIHFLCITEKGAIEEAKRCKTDEHDSEDEEDDDNLPEDLDEKDGSAEDKDQDEVDKGMNDCNIYGQGLLSRREGEQGGATCPGPQTSRGPQLEKYLKIEQGPIKFGRARTRH